MRSSPKRVVPPRPPAGAPIDILAPVRRQGGQPGLREELATGWPELVLYVTAGMVYVAVGAALPEFLFSGLVGVVFLLLYVIAVPALARRFRR